LPSNYAYIGAVLSDPHAGAFDPNQWYDELNKGFLNYIDKLEILDFLVITGDYFHTKISANSEYAKYALKFLTRVLKICAEKNTKFRIIKGTESHDNKQLEMFDGLRGVANCDFRVIHTVEKEWLFEDMHVLYIPEEYMEDKDEYYKEYFEDTYDYVFGHGLVDKAVFIAATQESETTRSQAPIFKTDELHAICKGPIYFGHIHKPMLVGRFRYVGSYSRWAFGEEEDKGFLMTYYTPESSDYIDEFIVNKNARRFDTVKIEYTSTVFNKTEKEQMEYLLKLASSLVVDYLRLEVNIPEEYPNPMLLTNMLNETFSKYSKVKLKINNNSKLRQKKETEEKVNKLLDMYGFIFDKSIEPDEKIVEYIKIKYQRNIPIERMRMYLHDEILARRGK
jgi:DNA repair exonuclease SbcCD nuclease subunit